jgi:hypothetical protein
MHLDTFDALATRVGLLVPLLDSMGCEVAKRVNLDAMIPRADFGEVENGGKQERITSFGLEQLAENHPIFRALRKPDFQRETNHWSPQQICDLIQSFLDDELVPSLILWESTSFIFVIDGGHRLSALKAWISDDYGDNVVSHKFYKGSIPRDQKAIAKATRLLVEEKVGRYSDLATRASGDFSGADIQQIRANRMFRRVLPLQWVVGSKDKAESSFYKINSQGTILDDIETTLIKNRRKPIAIAARSIIRAGTGHKYGSDFNENNQAKLAEKSAELYKILFEPEVESPLKTLDVPLGGSVSPVGALALLIDFLAIAGRPQAAARPISAYDDDPDGAETINLLNRVLKVARRITTNSPGSLGLHPAVYYYSAQGKHSRFLMLGITNVISNAVINNNDGFFFSFTSIRKKLEKFLIENKGLIGLIIQNIDSKVRLAKTSEMFSYLVEASKRDAPLSVEGVLKNIGVSTTVYDVSLSRSGKAFSDSAKAQTYVARAIGSALRCPQCGGLLSPIHSSSYDHIIAVRDGGEGNADNCEIMHPFCNTAMKN